MKKKICFVVSSPLTVKAFLKTHVQVLSAEYDIYLVANFKNEEKIEELNVIESRHIEIHRTINLWKDLNALIKLYSYIKKNKFDAVHTVTPKAGFLGITGAKIAGIKIRVHIFTGQVWANKKGFFKYFLKHLDVRIANNTTHNLVDGVSQREFLIQNNVLTTKNSFVLGKGSISGVDIVKFSKNDEQRDLMRKDLNFHKSDVVYIFLGRLNIDKGVLDLAHAFNKLSLNHSDVKLLIVGHDEAQLEKQMLEIIKPSHSVTFCGATNTPQKFLQAADIFCLPSYREGFGTSVIEASAVGLPVLCSNIYGLNDAFIENETGLRHEVGNSTSIYGGMISLYNDKALRQKMGDNGEKYVNQFFQSNTISQEWLNFYNNIFSK